jgi:hypothetical protein
MLLLRLVKALTKANISYAIAGGYAVALHGAVRGTVDIDIVLALKPEAYERIEGALASIGLRSRIPVTGKEVLQFREEYIRKRNLIAWGFINPSDPTEVVDVIITHDVSRLKTEKVSVQGLRINLLSKKSLIAMKRKSARPQDLEDIRALEKL